MKRLSLLGLICLIICTISALGNTYALNPKSANYELNEVQFGSGSLHNASSTSYKANESLGNTTGGRSSSSNYQAFNGFLTPNEPFLSISVGTTNVNLNTLSTTSAATGTGTFSVTAYVDSGYVVESVNNPPTQEDGHPLKNLTTPSASSPGTEQFGINMVQNLTTCATPSPVNFGSNPVALPSNTYANGIAATGYNTCGLFKYVPGDVIAQSSNPGWGETDYTISYLVNIAAYTPAGHYTMAENLVAIATY